MRKFPVLISTIILLIIGFSFPVIVKAEVPSSFATNDIDASETEEITVDSKASSITWCNQETGYLVILEDDADLLSDVEESQLALEMQKITAYGNVAFKSISYNDYSTSYFASDYYHETFRKESGTLFLIDMDNREIYIFSDGAIYKTITVSYADTITDNVYRYASDGDYYGCASKAFRQIYSLLSGQKIAQPMKYISNALLALILAALINYFLARLLSATSKPGTDKVLNSISTNFAFANPRMTRTRQTKVYSPPSSSSGGGGSHSSGGGGGRSHSSGGGGGHRF